MMAQKNRNKKFYKKVRKLFSGKNFFDPNFLKNLYLWPFSVKNSINLVSLQRSMDEGMRVITQNDYDTILSNWVKKFKVSPPPPKSKNRFLEPKMAINDQKCSNFFLDRNRFRMVRNVFQNENIDFENFFH